MTTSPQPSRPLSDLLLGALLACAVFAAYIPAINGGLIWDSKISSAGLLSKPSRGGRLVQARAAESFQVMLPVRIELDGQFAGDPPERNVGL